MKNQKQTKNHPKNKQKKGCHKFPVKFQLLFTDKWRHGKLLLTKMFTTNITIISFTEQVFCMRSCMRNSFLFSYLKPKWNKLNFNRESRTKQMCLVFGFARVTLSLQEGYIKEKK